MTYRELLQEALESIEWLRLHLERDHGCLHMKPAVSGISDWLNKTEASLRARLAQLNDFNPDWDAMAVMVEEQQHMAKRIEELTQLVTSQGIRLMDAEAQPEQKPVAWKMKGVPAFATSRPNDTDSIKWDALYTAPPQREWVGLTGEELQEIYQSAGTVHFKFAMVEAKLKEKN